jgi:hexosaminidase
MDPTANATYDLISTLVAELDPIFPAEFPFWHMGGDEVQFDCWRLSTSGYIDKFMQNHGIVAGDYSSLQGYFEQRVIDVVRALPSKKRTVLWEESTNRASATSGLPKDAVVQLFHEDNGNASVLDATVSGGWQVFYTTRDWYFDHGKTLTDGSWEYDYGLEPFANSTLPEAQLDAAVLGSESCMWSPHFDSTNFLTEAFPRAAAVAERLWSARGVRVGLGRIVAVYYRSFTPYQIR